MTYKKTIWVDQNVERPKTYEFTNNSDGSTTLTESFGNVVELGTPVNALNMNHIEDGIESVAIRFYNADESYDAGEWVLGTVNGNRGIYESAVDDNENNPLTDTNYWTKVKLGGSDKNIGGLCWSLLPVSDIGLHLLDGSLLQGSGVYAEFVNYIKTLYEDDPNANYFETENNWQASVTQYGVCGKFVYDSVNNTVRLPKVTGFIEGTIDETALGDLVEAGLPNITGWVGNNLMGSESYPQQGSLYYSAPQGHIGAGTGSTAITNINIDASISNSIYGNSSTVQPQAIKGFLYMVVATGGKTTMEADIDEIATDLNGKLDTDLTNMAASQSAKNTIMGWNIPDYANGISVNSSAGTYTAPSNGTLDIAVYGGVIGHTSPIKINGVDVHSSPTVGGGEYRNNFSYLVNKNDVITWSANAGGVNLIFYPLKGVN